MAKDFTQKEAIDYSKTFAPLTRLTALSLLPAIAAVEDLEVHQVDIKSEYI